MKEMSEKMFRSVPYFMDRLNQKMSAREIFGDG